MKSFLLIACFVIAIPFLLLVHGENTAAFICLAFVVVLGITLYSDIRDFVLKSLR